MSSSPAQAAANAANAPSSTGPQAESGNAAPSQNPAAFTVFSGDFIRPGEKSGYATLNAALNYELAPVTILEEVLVEEIHRAMWRLRRCGEVESHLVLRLDDGKNYIFDPMETADARAKEIQQSVDRARSQAHRLLHKATAELRKLQTERRRNEASQAAMHPANQIPASLPKTAAEAAGHSEVSAPTAAIPAKIPAENPNPSAKLHLVKSNSPRPAGIPRNALCPCGSGQKYKRCCGKTAPALLFAV